MNYLCVTVFASIFFFFCFYDTARIIKKNVGAITGFLLVLRPTICKNSICTFMKTQSRKNVHPAVRGNTFAQSRRFNGTLMNMDELQNVCFWPRFLSGSGAVVPSEVGLLLIQALWHSMLTEKQVALLRLPTYTQHYTTAKRNLQLCKLMTWMFKECLPVKPLCEKWCIY